MAKSIISNARRCYICGSTWGLEKHHIFNGAAYRKKSEADGMWVHLCRDCHHKAHTSPLLRELKKTGEKVWLQEKGDLQAFMKRYGKDYIMEG